MIELVAGHLLDVNALDLDNTDLSEEVRANVGQNLADAITQLPKLCTGVDVNVRFHDIKGFEVGWW